eukprot:8709658-Pyramimonas_sp.AAC.1
MHPKHHLFRHLAAHICRKGNPRYYNTYWDESINGVIAKIANTTHRARFERMVFRKYGYFKTEGPPGRAEEVGEKWRTNQKNQDRMVTEEEKRRTGEGERRRGRGG